jgi:hypothetical protein
MSDVSHISSAARQMARREIAILARLLKSGEEVVDVCHGNAADGRAAVVAITDRRVVYLQRRPLWGAHVDSVPLARVRSAEERIGVRHATVTVDAGGRWFELTDVDRALAQMFCARLRSRIVKSS